MRKIFVYFFFFIVTCQFSFGQSSDIYQKYNIYRSPFRVFINKFSWTLTSGYAATDYKHDLKDFYFFQDPDNQYILSRQQDPLPIFLGAQNWLNDATPGQSTIINNTFDIPYNYLESPVNNPLLKNQQFLADGDTLGLSFSAIAPTIPILLSLHFDIRKFRVGLGFQFERHNMKPLKPSILAETIRPYQPSFDATNYIKYFGIFGYRFYEFWNYSFVAELQLGRSKPGSEINTSAIGIGQRFFGNLGVSIENNLSEYVRVVFRPSYDFKSYVINLSDASSIRHKNSGFMFQVGLSINIPEIPRTPISSDHVQLKHVITDPKTGRLTEVRGQRMWKKQNPKVGENHRRLWRYKLKNRRKIDPY
ncbi:MAG: hypothetical protein JXR10_01545 [Cyclobacteriaceae bacterium]